MIILESSPRSMTVQQSCGQKVAVLKLLMLRFGFFSQWLFDNQGPRINDALEMLASSAVSSRLWLNSEISRRLQKVGRCSATPAPLLSLANPGFG